MSIFRLWDEDRNFDGSDGVHVIKTKDDLHAVKTWMGRNLSKDETVLKRLLFDKINIGYAGYRDSNTDEDAQIVEERAQDGYGLRTMRRLLTDFFLNLRDFKSLQVLDLSDCAVSDTTVESHLYESLIHNTGLKKLFLRQNKLTDQGIKLVFEALVIRQKPELPNPPVLTHLDFSGNDGLTSVAGDHIRKALVSHGLSGLQSLNLSSCKNFGAQGLKYIVDGLVEVNEALSLSNLNLANVALGDSGADEVVRMLKSYVNLKILNISECGMNYEGTQKIASCLCTASVGLEDLDISKNFIGDVGLTYFSSVVANNPHLRKLKMMKCEFGAKVFVDSFLYKLGLSCDNASSKLEELNVSYNALGDTPIPELTSVLSRYHCKINTIGYDANSMTDEGMKKWAEFFKDHDKCYRRNVPKDVLTEHAVVSNGLNKLTLKQNYITKSGIQKFTKALVEAEEDGESTCLRELDLRKNNIGRAGAKLFKYFFLSRPEEPWPFTLNIYPKDVGGPEGINHLIIGMRQAGGGRLESTPNTIDIFQSALAMSDSDFLNFVKERESFKKTESSEYHEQVLLNIYEEYDDRKLEDLSKRPSSKIFLKQIEDDDPVNYLEFANMATHTSKIIQAKPRFGKNGEVAEIIWAPWIWDEIRKGYTSIVSNGLYRLSYLIDIIARKWDLQGLKKSDNPFSRKIIWENLMLQKCRESEGLTMIEFCLKHGKAPLIDFLHQVVSIAPVSKDNTILNQWFARGGTIREICLKHADSQVRRWASSKSLINYRYQTIEKLYVSKAVEVHYVEDMFQVDVDEIDETKRFFHVRIFPELKNAAIAEEARDRKDEIDRMMRNEDQAYNGFEKSSDRYALAKTNAFNVKKIIQYRLNEEGSIIDPDKLFRFQANMSNDTPSVNILKPYIKTLRQVMDDEAIAGGQNLKRIRHIALCLANALRAFNDRQFWLERMDPEDKEDVLDEKWNRIHGNIKPRNIVMLTRGWVQTPEESLNDEEMETWVVTDFTRSVVHKQPYAADANSAYIAPEVAARYLTVDKAVVEDVKADAKMDVWAFGAVLYELLAGIPLFHNETREDTIISKQERAELVNWTALDEERCSYIMRLSSEDEKKEYLDYAKNLVLSCLQGDPNRRPSFHDIMYHPFLCEQRFQGPSTTILDVLGIKAAVKVWSKEKVERFGTQPHAHFINTNIPDLYTTLHALEETFHQNGCRITYDAMEKDEKELITEAGRARLVICFLSDDCFNKPMVINQLKVAYEEQKKFDYDVRDYKNKRIVFIDTGSTLRANKWDKDKFLKEPKSWYRSDQFHYLTIALANDKNFSFSESSSATNSRPTNVGLFLENDFHPSMRPYIEASITYRSEVFLANAMIDRLFESGGLRTQKLIKAYKAQKMSSGNFISNDKFATAEQRLEKKYKSLYILPDGKEHKCQHRVYILSADKGKQAELAVLQITSALEVSKFSKVKHPFNTKKVSGKYFTTKPRITNLEKLLDFASGNTIDYGKLVLIILISPGVFEKFKDFLIDAVETRKDDLVIVPFFMDIDKAGMTKEYETLMKELPDVLKPYFRENVDYIPFIQKKYGWLNDATVSEVVERTKYYVENTHSQLTYITGA